MVTKEELKEDKKRFREELQKLADKVDEIIEPTLELTSGGEDTKPEEELRVDIAVDIVKFLAVHVTESRSKSISTFDIAKFSLIDEGSLFKRKMDEVEGELTVQLPFPQGPKMEDEEDKERDYIG